MMTETATLWRDDLDALSFAVLIDCADGGAACLVHRRAFRILIGYDPVAADCLAYYENNATAFHAAAAAKISRQSIPPGRSLHLNSRDIRRALGAVVVRTELSMGRECRLLVPE